MRITVVGDLILDRYWTTEDVGPLLDSDQGNVRRLVSQQDGLGGAAAVAGIIRRAGVPVTLGGVVGDDAEGRRMWELLQNADIPPLEIWCDNSNATTLKLRTLQGGRIVGDRFDRETCRPLADFAWTCLAHIDLGDMLVLQDYGKGVLDTTLCFALIARAVKARLPVLVDPARGVPWSRYRGATLIKANQLEARQEAARLCGQGQHWNALSLAEFLQEQTGQTIVVTEGKRGMAWANSQGSGHVQAEPAECLDCTGAGDTVLAALAVRWPCYNLPDACSLAAVAAAKQVARVGVAPVSIPAGFRHPVLGHGALEQVASPDPTVSCRAEP